MTKISKPLAGYRNAAPGSQKRCGSCSMFVKGAPNHCTLVAGVIDARDTCKHWEGKRGAKK